MSYYTILINAWNGVVQPPTGVTGTGLTVGMTTQQKLDAVNAWTVVGAAQKCIIPVYQIINAIAPADFLALTATQLSQLQLLLNAGTVDVSPGTTIRAIFQSMFVGKTTTINNLVALVKSFDSPPVLWWQANGYGSPFGVGDLAAAGGLT
jgi:hypothetical protein